MSKQGAFIDPAKDPKATSVTNMLRGGWGSKPAGGLGMQYGRAGTSTLFTGREESQHSEGIKDDGNVEGRDEVAMGGKPSVLFQQQSLAGPPVPSKDYYMFTGHNWDDKRPSSADRWLGGRAPKMQSVYRGEDEYREMQARVDRLAAENRSLQQELKMVTSSLEDARSLSQTRADELRGAQVFLTKTDVLSAADIIQKATVLNSEIHQTASRFEELLHNTHDPHKAVRQPTSAENEILGKKLASDLSNHRMTVNSDTEPKGLLIQVVFQIAITNFCGSAVSSWGPNNQQLAESMLSIYTGIRQAESQAVAGRWRSITRAQLRRSSSNDADCLQNLMPAVKGILDIAGWSIPEKDQQKFEKRMPPLLKAVQNLRKALGEDTTSMDVVVIVPPAGGNFDPNCMTDGFEDKNSPSLSMEKVVGATGLGLGKRKDGTNKLEMMLLPQVALEKVMDEAMKPESTKPRRAQTRRRTNTES